MAYDEGLAQRIREIVLNHPGMTEKKMFGGLAFMDRGNMCCGIIRSELMVRVGAEKYSEALEKPFAREMDFTGKAMRGYVYIAEDGIDSDIGLHFWVKKGLDFTATLPEKAGKK
ncbi:TfoX/Sxy family protein [candidate division KSB1 bacterium]|nr:TfoX/Sxy family protein [candidate division KSB1 bacterium]